MHRFPPCQLDWQGGAPHTTDADLYYFTPEQQAMFYQPAAGQLGNIGCNFFPLPRNFNIAMTVGQKFAIAEKQDLQLRLEVQSLTNSAVYDTPYSSNITSGSFA